MTAARRGEMRPLAAKKTILERTALMFSVVFSTSSLSSKISSKRSVESSRTVVILSARAAWREQRRPDGGWTWRRHWLPERLRAWQRTRPLGARAGLGDSVIWVSRVGSILVLVFG